MTLARFAFSFLIVFGLSSAAQAACDPRVDRNCTDDSSDRIERERRARESEITSPRRYDPASSPSTRNGFDAGSGGGGGGRTRSLSTGGGTSPTPSGSEGGAPPPSAANGHRGFRDGGALPRVGSSAPGGSARPLQPVRAYLRASQIPPEGAGAYGLVVFHSRPTPASRAKLKMVCTSFVAFFPRQETATAAVRDQMITVWPLDNPDAIQARNDDCDFAVDHYDLIASQAAMSDAQRQRADFGGEGPYLVGWSPSNTRGVPDALVLVVDMSADNRQADIDNKFLFWKNKIIDDPAAWRHGWSTERVRVSIRNFADEYGQSMLDAIKLIGSK
jgi:hypothetical protein